MKSELKPGMIAKYSLGYVILKERDSKTPTYWFADFKSKGTIKTLHTHEDNLSAVDMSVEEFWNRYAKLRNADFVEMMKIGEVVAIKFKNLNGNLLYAYKLESRKEYYISEFKTENDFLEYINEG